MLIGRTPTKNEKHWMDSIQKLGCIVCRVHFETDTPAEIHHIEGKVEENCHFLTLPLCAQHHRSGNGSGPFLSRHPWKYRFEDRFGKELELWAEVCDLVGYNPLETRGELDDHD